MEDQRKKHQTWWQRNHKRFIISASAIAVLIIFALTVWRFGWDWTGFNGGYSQITTTNTNHGTTTATLKPPGKNLWDLLQLLGVLAIPIVVGFGGIWFTRIQQLRDQQLADQRAESERKVAENRAELERELTRDNQHETLLQTYIDKLSELLLQGGLRESDPEKEVRKIAHVRTLTVLPRLDADRKRNVLQFLYESGLIYKGKRIIDLRDANLNGANLLLLNLSRADLSGAFLTADLTFANLSGADLHQAHLLGANLSNANLVGADLSETNLARADLKEANLSDANLKDAKNITTEDLEKQTKSLKDAIMPDGSKHP